MYPEWRALPPPPLPPPLGVNRNLQGDTILRTGEWEQKGGRTKEREARATRQRRGCGWILSGRQGKMDNFSCVVFAQAFPSADHLGPRRRHPLQRILDSLAHPLSSAVITGSASKLLSMLGTRLGSS